MKNLFSIERGVAKITLTQNQTTFVDVVDLSLIAEYKWCSQKNSNTWYAVTTIRLNNRHRTTLYMHRLLMGLEFGDISQVDHDDGNGLNNCFNNLKITTHTGNQHNLHCKKLNCNYEIPTSKFQGVSWNKRIRKWIAQIRCKNKSIHLGYYRDEMEAHSVYCQAKVVRDAGGNIDEIKSVIRRY